MKLIIISTVALLAFFQLTQAKESKQLAKAFEDYQKHTPGHKKSEVSPEMALSELLTKEKSPPANDKVTVEDILNVLSIVRDSPSKKLIPQLKELWKIHQLKTFRVMYPESWKSVRGRDYDQNICDEIKLLIQGIGGNVDDLEIPVEKPQTPSPPKK